MTSEQSTKICVLTSVHRADDPRIFYRQCRSLVQAGYDVTLIAPSDFNGSRSDGVVISKISPGRSRWARPWVWWRLLRKTVSIKPNLIHIHDPELLLIVPFLRWALKRNVRIIYDVHEYFVDSIAHKVWIPPYLRKAAAWLAQKAERALGKFVDGLILVVEEQIPLYAGWPAARIVVHNYPDFTLFSDPKPRAEFPADRFRIIYIGSLYARRGIMTMLKAFTQVICSVPEAMLILGGSFESEGFRSKADRFIREHNLDNHVAFVGWVNHTELKDYLASADVAWLPGLRVKQYHRPSLSTKQLECMLMRLPIVSSDLPHRRQVIKEAGCGFSVSAEDPQAHAEAILRLYRNPDKRRTMGENGRNWVLNTCNWKTEALALVRFYETLQLQDET